MAAIGPLLVGMTPAFAVMTLLWAGVASAIDPNGAATSKAQPALIAAKAAHNRLLDLAVAGSQLVAVGEQGVILNSADGQTWTQVQSPVNGMLTRLRFQDERRGWALGYEASILQTTDAGQTWAVRHYDASARPLYDLLFIDAQRGIAVGGYGSILTTDDGGQTWTAQDSELADLGMHLNVILQLGDGSVLVAGERGLMARSIDAGASWQLLDFPYAGSIFGALAVGDQGLLAYGMRGKVFEAADLSACPPVAAASWDPYARETIDDTARIAALGWRRLDNPVQESLFGAVRTGRTTVLVGVNGTAVRLDPDRAALVELRTSAAETLARVVVFKGRLIGVGRRGVQDLGAAP